MPRLDGENIYLESVKPQNIALIRQWSVKTRDSFFLNKTTLTVSTDYLAMLVSSLDHQFYLAHNRGGQPLGVLLFSNIHNPQHIAEVSLTLQPSKNNTKLLQETLEVGLINLFSKTNLVKVYCHCQPHELELKKILLECFFKKEGQLNEHLFYNNKFHDQEIFGLPREDYYR
ncbi:MAG: GNAT family N-acetyltransferase [Candidatus Margulisbacteria bacterium]|jgi:RimJ/RimL family protein N-acetyltransferase|nr:GNAT family N-acetyltransferase [Candidatus Margulisiibacteriota bacterium]